MFTPQQVRQMHENLVKRIFAEDYYIKTYNFVAERRKVDLDDPASINAFWNDFWYLLPDSSAIRKGPFIDMCIMAEGEYLDNEDEEE